MDLRAELDEVKQNITLINEKQSEYDKHKLPERLDELDQYGRRNMIRLSGVPETGDSESTIDVVIETIKKNLNIELQKSDIDRTHRLGTYNSNATNPRSIVIKFSNYTSRSLIYGERRRLRDTKLFLNDHLTATRSRYLYIARLYKKSDLITNAWSAEGRILVRDKADKKTFAIVCLSDLTAFDPEGKVKIPPDTAK